MDVMGPVKQTYSHAKQKRAPTCVSAVKEIDPAAMRLPCEQLNDYSCTVSPVSNICVNWQVLARLYLVGAHCPCGNWRG